MKKLDDFEYDNLDFVKIDVEGYENKVILGAENTLKKHKPIIIVEQKKYSSRYGEDEFQALDTLQRYGANVLEQVYNDFIFSW